MSNYKIILSGGGTGGHIYPAIAIADEIKLRYPSSDFLFVGANDRMEMDKVPEAGYKIEGLWISGFQRRLTLKNMMFPLKLIKSLLRSQKIIKAFKPNVVMVQVVLLVVHYYKLQTQRKCQHLYKNRILIQALLINY